MLVTTGHPAINLSLLALQIFHCHLLLEDPIWLGGRNTEYFRLFSECVRWKVVLNYKNSPMIKIKPAVTASAKTAVDLLVGVSGAQWEFIVGACLTGPRRCSQHLLNATGEGIGAPRGKELGFPCLDSGRPGQGVWAWGRATSLPVVDGGTIWGRDTR